MSSAAAFGSRCATPTNRSNSTRARAGAQSVLDVPTWSRTAGTRAPLSLCFRVSVSGIRYRSAEAPAKRSASCGAGRICEPLLGVTATRWVVDDAAPHDDVRLIILDRFPCPQDTLAAETATLGDPVRALIVEMS